MNVRAIEPTAAAQTAAVAFAPAKKGARASAAPMVAAAETSPAAAVTFTAVPASVRPSDRALYLQILKSVGGNAGAAIAELKAREASEAK